MKQLPLNDFTGGITSRLASSDFTPRQWAQIKGLVIEDDFTLRSQWRLQKLPTLTIGSNVKWIQTFRGQYNDFLVYGNPRINYLLEPSPDADDATVATGTWTQIALSHNGDTPGAIVELQDASSEGFRAAIAQTTPTGADVGFVVQADGDPNALDFIDLTNVYPQTTEEGDPDTPALPNGGVTAYWNNTLVIGDIRWLDDVDLPFDASNNKRYRNGLWFAQPGDPDSYDTLDVVFVGQPDLQITGLVPIDLGLLVFVRADSSNAGAVWLLRGTPASFVMEPLRQGMSAVHASLWPHTGGVVFSSGEGECWATNGDQTMRLDAEYLELNRTVSDDDVAVGFGPYVLWWHDDRLLCFRALGDEGAWTELVIPDDWAGIKHMWSSGLCLYLVVEKVGGGLNEVWRFTRDERAGARGYADGNPLTLTLGSPTLSSEDHTETYWHQFGIRYGQGRAGNPGELVSVRTAHGPDEDPHASETFAVNDTSLDRDELVVPAPGPTVEASFRASFQGDVSVEAVNVYYHRARRSR